MRVVVVVVGLVLAGVAAFLLLRAPAPVVTVLDPQLMLGFPGATGWHEESACHDVDATDACAGEWTFQSGQKVRVLLVPVVDPERLTLMTQKLKQRVEEQGGVVGELPYQGGKAVRMLQPVVRAEDNVDLVNISYVLPAPDRRLLHIVTSLVSHKEQVEADQRIRDLLAFAAWVEPAASSRDPPQQER